MKKIVSLIVLLAAMTMTAQAQKPKFGVKGGLNLTSMKFSRDAVKSDNQAGFYVGPTLKFTLPIVGLGFDVAALYDQRSTKVENKDGNQGTGEEKIKQKSIQVPINVRYNIGLGSEAGIYLAVGPQFGFPVGDKVYNTKVGDYRLKDASVSFNFGAGVYLLEHLEVGFAYNLVTKSGELTDQNGNIIDTRNNAWQIGAAIYF